MDQHLVSQAERMNAFRRRRFVLLSPEERMESVRQLQQAAWEQLSANPEALAAFHRRQYAKRRPEEVERLFQLTWGDREPT